MTRRVAAWVLLVLIGLGCGRYGAPVRRPVEAPGPAAAIAPPPASQDSDPAEQEPEEEEESQ